MGKIESRKLDKNKAKQKPNHQTRREEKKHRSKLEFTKSRPTLEELHLMLNPNTISVRLHLVLTLIRSREKP